MQPYVNLLITYKLSPEAVQNLHTNIIEFIRSISLDLFKLSLDIGIEYNELVNKLY